MTEPAAHIAKADHIVAVVLQAAGQQPSGHPHRRRFGEEQKAILGHGRVERRAEFLPVGQQFVQPAGVHHCAGQNMRADFGAFFDDANADFVALFGGQLF